MAVNQGQLAEMLDRRDYELISAFRQTLIDMLKYYYYVGGMPEAVSCFAEETDFNEVREIQKKILIAYEQDFSKHAPIEIVPKNLPELCVRTSMADYRNQKWMINLPLYAIENIIDE